jgi:hypothetical protein
MVDGGGGGGKYTTNGIKSKSSWPNRRREGWRSHRHRHTDTDTDTDTHKSKEEKQQLEHHNNIIHTCMQA